MKIEFTGAELLKLEDQSKATLAVISTLGAVALSMVFPNLIKAVGPLYLDKARKSRTNNQPRKLIQYTRAKRSIYYLRKRNLLELDGHGEQAIVKLTEKGKKWLHKIKLKHLDTPTKQTWNKKWWVIASDIPSKSHRREAEQFRTKLRSMGFYSLQKSLWIYPFNPLKEIETVANHMDVLKFITIMEVSRIETQDHMKLMKFFYFL